MEKLSEELSHKTFGSFSHLESSAIYEIVYKKPIQFLERYFEFLNENDLKAISKLNSEYDLLLPIFIKNRETAESKIFKQNQRYLQIESMHKSEDESLIKDLVVANPDLYNSSTGQTAEKFIEKNDKNYDLKLSQALFKSMDLAEMRRKTKQPSVDNKDNLSDEEINCKDFKNEVMYQYTRNNADLTGIDLNNAQIFDKYKEHDDEEAYFGV